MTLPIKPTEQVVRTEVQTLVVAGRLTDPTFGNAARGFMDGMCEGARPSQPPVEITGTKEQMLADVFARVNKAFA